MKIKLGKATKIISIVLAAIFAAFILVSSILQWNQKFYVRTYREAVYANSYSSAMYRSKHYEKFVEKHPEQGVFAYGKD